MSRPIAVSIMSELALFCALLLSIGPTLGTLRESRMMCASSNSFQDQREAFQWRNGGTRGSVADLSLPRVPVRPRRSLERSVQEQPSCLCKYCERLSHGSTDHFVRHTSMSSRLLAPSKRIPKPPGPAMHASTG
jgi:hypothetical protein